ncbi:MAG: adenosine deaminase [Micrococcales bacterium]
MNIRKLPKISLHDHLDGGLRPQTIIELAEEIGMELPANNAADLNKWFLESANSGSLVEYLKTFDITTGVMQTKHGLTRVAREFVEDLHKDGVIYGEIRWAPEQHLSRGLTLDEVVDAVQDGLDEGVEAVEAAGGYIRTGQLVTAMRHNNRGLEIAELAVRHRDNGVVGFDIAGAEAGFPASNHKEAFDYLAEQMFPTTVHAGEADGIESIRDAIVAGRTLRLGHGVRIYQDLLMREEDGRDYVQLGDVAEWVHFRQIALELCPTSNLQTGAIADLGDTYEDHPVAILFDLGFRVTISPDNRLMSGTSVTHELEQIVEHFDFDLDDLEQLQLNAVEACFQTLDAREELAEMIQEGFAKARR